MAIGKPHKGHEGEVNNENAETDGEQKERLEFFHNSEINEQAAHAPHDDDVPLEMCHTGRLQGSV